MKAQIISLDIMFAIVIILIILTSMTVVLLQYTSFEEEQSENRDIEIKTQTAINSLLLTPGVPSDWEVNITKSI